MRSFGLLTYAVACLHGSVVIFNYHVEIDFFLSKFKAPENRPTTMFTVTVKIAPVSDSTYL